MQLKKLDILGFKSFPERTRIELVEGVTAIVGPNGCGKTNILDALRWVMGEQRPTLLRGGRMEDVIFNGSQRIKPQGLAEVSLMIENTRGVLPTEYDELQITRRLFRSGDSEYLLNRTQCRLKDITDLFADTGMGANAYSVIQQHMVDSLISDKAEDRRILFEEAAGITKYKQRKRAALRKLESTEGDLRRLNDILSEVKSQVNSLNRQMKKAERYQKTRERLKELEVALARVTLSALATEGRGKELELANLRSKVTEYETALSSLGATVESERTQQSEFDSTLADVTREIQAKTESGHRIEVSVSTLKARMESLGDTRESNTRDIAACEERSKLIEAEESGLKQELVNSERSVSEQMVDLSRAEEHSQAADKALLEARRNSENETETLMSLEGRISSGRTDTQNLSSREEELNAQIRERQSQLEDVSGRLNAAGREQFASSDRLAQINARISGLSEESVRVNEQIDVCGQKLELRTDQITDLSAAQEAAQARMRMLKEMIERHEGFGSGVAAALDNKASWPGLLGAVAEVITPRSEHTAAIEAALDDIAAYLVTEDRTTAQAVISYLRREKKGRAAVFSLEGLETSAESGMSAQRRPLEEKGFIGWADRLIDPDERIGSLARSLLGNTAVFDATLEKLSASERDALLERMPTGCQVVSSTGELYRGRSVFAGGSKDDLPRFGRRERLAELEQEYLRLQKELETVRERKNSETAEAARLRARLVETESKLESARDERVSAEKEAAEIGATINSLQADEKRLSKDKSAAAVSLEALKQRQYTLSLDVDQLSSEKERLVSDLGERSAALSQFETAAQGAAEELNKKRVALVETRSRTQQLVDRIRHQQELRTEISQTIRNKTSENERALTEIESSVSEITVLEKRLESVLQERAGLSEKESELRQRRDSVVGSLRERESESRDVRSRKERTVNETHVLELRFAQIENERSNILGRMREEYDIQPETFSFSFSGDSSHGADQFDTEEKRLTGNEQIEALKQKLKSHGAVNLLAIEEYDSATERFDFLSRQLEDLTQAKATLQSTINKINATARELFNETFGKARDNFRDIFTELFDGGECDIRLTDASNPLESEIEIIAKPKGKKLVTITQMSGGERALTAISLLFSLYLVKPSPFCILDEIDAPLDDANCHRFLKLIRRFSNQTQFIVITHNKITMEAADTLYGVTMESPGVSKLVSVRFGEVDEEGRVSLSRAEVPDAAEEIASDETEVEVPAAVVERLAPTVGASDRTAE